MNESIVDNTVDVDVDVVDDEWVVDRLMILLMILLLMNELMSIDDDPVDDDWVVDDVFMMIDDVVDRYIFVRDEWIDMLMMIVMMILLMMMCSWWSIYVRWW